MQKDRYPHSDTDFDRMVGYEQARARIQTSGLIWRYGLKIGMYLVIGIIILSGLVIVLEYTHPNAGPEGQKTAATALTILSDVLSILKVMAGIFEN